MASLDRFSLLLLEPGEIYFEDFAAIYLLPEEQRAEGGSWEDKFEDGFLRGRLKVCSRSLVFEPREVRAPLVKLPLRSLSCPTQTTTTRPTDHPPTSEGEREVLSAVSSLTVEMLEGARVEPYKFCREERTHMFQLVYVEVSEVLPQVCQLHRAASLPPNDQNTMVQAIVRSRQRRKTFDRSLLYDLQETEVVEKQASKVTPLVTNPGTLFLTNANLYFQPHNNADKAGLVRVSLGQVCQVIQRRYLLRQVGLEVFWRDHSSQHNLLLVFKEEAERDLVKERLLGQAAVQLDDLTQDNMTFQWQAGAVSNFDYLLYLNSQADRSTHDLTQYPVFPWVIADYHSPSLDLDRPGTFRDLSRPIGALNYDRLRRLKERCAEMPEPRFLYGSHYSTPGFVLYYLVRQFPQYMLSLNTGRFDHPDRMFNSLSDTWRNVTTNPSDFKELVPEFYDTAADPHFLTNSLSINFGVRQNGQPVGDVQLPPWASGPRELVEGLRRALECEQVSSQLHQWIDLIFGYKQRGEEAFKADNVFYHLCYEGAVDLAAINDLNDRLALEVQITEFGQVPRQLFQRPHPPRLRSYALYRSPRLCPSSSPAPKAQAAVGEGVWERLGELRVVGEAQAHKNEVLGLTFTHEGTQVVTVGRDALIKVHRLPDLEQVRSMRVGSLAAAACHHMPGSDTVLVASWDNNVYSFSLEYSQVGCLLAAHNDAVSCLTWADSLLITGSWDCMVRVWKLPPDPTRWPRPELSPGQIIVCEMDHDAPVTCLALHPEGHTLATGTTDGTVELWSLPEATLLHHLSCHDTGTVSGLTWSSREGRLLTAGTDGRLLVLEPHTGATVCQLSLDLDIRCVAWEGRLVVAGAASGELVCLDLGTGEVLQRVQAHTGAITCLAVAVNQRYVATGGQDRRLLLWATTQEPQDPAADPCNPTSGT